MPQDAIPTQEFLEQVLQPGDRCFTIALPRSYTGDQPAPMILALHVAGHGTPFYGKLILTELVEPALRELNAIIVAPDCTGSDWSDRRSEADVLAVLDHVRDNYNIDPHRTLITGYSMGGMGAWYLASRHQERFSAALIMAGLPPADATTIAWRIPLYLIQSRHDELMPLQPTEAVVEQLKANGASVELRILEGITHFETWRYTEPLRTSIPWIENAWRSDPI
jgi:predicted peptidase